MYWKECCRGNEKGEVGRFSNGNQSEITLMNLSKNIKSICYNPSLSKLPNFPVLPVGISSQSTVRVLSALMQVVDTG